MTMLKTFAFLLVAGLIGMCGLELAGQLPIPGVEPSRLDFEGRSRASTHACQCRRVGATHVASLRGWRIQLLGGGLR